MRPENQLIIKDNLEDVYNSGDLVLKDTITNEFNKIDKEFKNNLLLLMNLKDTDVIINNFVNDFTFKRYFNINFPDLRKQLKEKYSSLDIKEFLFFIKEWYKNPKTLSLKNAVMKKFNNIKREIKLLKKKLKQKQLKHSNDPTKLRQYKNMEASVENMEEQLEDEKSYKSFNDEIKMDEFNIKMDKNQQIIQNYFDLISESNISDIGEKKKN